MEHKKLKWDRSTHVCDDNHKSAIEIYALSL